MFPHRTLRLIPGVSACLLLAFADALPAQDTPCLPFGPGEELVYRSKLGRLGGAGKGVMRVEAWDTVRAREAYVLSFEFHSKVGPFTVEAQSRSWVDPDGLVSLRFRKRERHPLSSTSEEVELYPQERRWEAAGGRQGRSTTDAPLDELSFIYHIRTLELSEGRTYVIERHFDPERNPVHVAVLRRERIAVPAGVFDVVVVEMRVRDPEHFGGDGAFRLYLTDDARRYPVRLETSASIAGTVVLELEAAVPGRVAGL